MILTTVKAIQNLVQALTGDAPNPVLTNVDALKQLYAARGGTEDVSQISLIPNIIQKIADNEQIAAGNTWLRLDAQIAQSVSGCSFAVWGYNYEKELEQVILSRVEKTLYVPAVRGVAILPCAVTLANGYRTAIATGSNNVEKLGESTIKITGDAKLIIAFAAVG